MYFLQTLIASVVADRVFAAIATRRGIVVTALVVLQPGEFIGRQEFADIAVCRNLLVRRLPGEQQIISVTLEATERQLNSF